MKGSKIAGVVVLAFVFVVLYKCTGRRYYYLEKVKRREAVVLIDNNHLRLVFDVHPLRGTHTNRRENFSAGLVFHNLSRDVIVKRARLSAKDAKQRDLELEAVSAVDGFYSWKEDKNVSRSSCAELPAELRTISKDIKAYFVYSWSFTGQLLDASEIAVDLDLLFEAGNKAYKISNTLHFQIESEWVFENPIRFH
jgi:hypothetical protein